MALHLRSMTILKGPDPPLPSLVDDDLEELEAQHLSSDTCSASAPTPSLRVLDAGTEASIRRKRAEREMWLDEAYTNFVQGMIDAGASLSSLYMNHKRISLHILGRLQIRQSEHERHLFGLLDDSPRGPAPAVAGLLPRHVAEAANRSLQTYEEPPRAQVGRDAAAL